MTYQLSQVQEQIATVLITMELSRDEPYSLALDSAIKRLAHTAEVEMFGKVGDMDTFKPLEHFLINPDEGVPEFVWFELPGVRAMRENGSHRVLTKALVKGVAL